MLETLKTFLFRKVNALLGAVLALLGCNSCSVEDEPALYGCPYAYYQVEGAVLDEAGNPLKDIQVVYKIPMYDSYYYSLDTVYTQADGTFKMEERSIDKDSVRVVAEDLNGVYAPDSMNVELSLTKKGKEGWCVGTYVGEAIIKMKKK